VQLDPSGRIDTEYQFQDFGRYDQLNGGACWRLNHKRNS